MRSGVVPLSPAAFAANRQAMLVNATATALATRHAALPAPGDADASAREFDGAIAPFPAFRRGTMRRQ
jgi:hypothetical protein